MSKQYTPGPWRLDDDIIRDTKGRCILDAFDANMALEDARLIAAAPEILEALVGLVGCIDYGSNNPTLKLEAARAAIAKATD